MPREWKKRRIEILECTQGYVGTEFTVFNLKANDSAGSPIDTKLNAFEIMPLGVQDVECSPYYKNGEFESITVRKPKDSGQSSLGALAGRLELAEEQGRELQRRVTALEERLDSIVRQDALAPARGPGDRSLEEAPHGRAADGTPLDDDIPF